MFIVDNYVNNIYNNVDNVLVTKNLHFFSPLFLQTFTGLSNGRIMAYYLIIAKTIIKN